MADQQPEDAGLPGDIARKAPFVLGVLPLFATIRKLTVLRTTYQIHPRTITQTPPAIAAVRDVVPF